MSGKPIFVIDQSVIIKLSGKPGVVASIFIGRQEQIEYRVEYVDGHGDIAERYFGGEQLQAQPG